MLIFRTQAAGMAIDYGHLFEDEPQALRYRASRSDAVEALLGGATGCVFGGGRGRLYLDIIIAMVPHRLEFDADVELQHVISQARAHGIPVHRDIEMVAVLAATWALAAAVIAFAIHLIR
jgi:hypothetical protein